MSFSLRVSRGTRAASKKVRQFSGASINMQSQRMRLKSSCMQGIQSDQISSVGLSNMMPANPRINQRIKVNEEE